MRIWITFFAGTLVLALGARAGAAQEERRGPPSPANFFERLDANQDRKITLDEVPDGAPEHVKAMLKQADRDGDKALTQDEVATAMRGFRSSRSRHDDQDKHASDERSGPPRSRRGEPGRSADRLSSREIERPDGEGPGRGHRSDMVRSGSRREDRDEARPAFDRSSGSHGKGSVAKFDKNEHGRIAREASVAHRHKKSKKIHGDMGCVSDREVGREAMIAGMKMRFAGRGSRDSAMRHATFGPPAFGRGVGLGPGRDGFKARSPMMAHQGHGFGWQMDHGMQGPGGPSFGRSSMAHGFRGPMVWHLWHRGPGRGPEMGRGMQGADGPMCKRCPMARGFGGPMMSHRGPRRGPEMGRGMQGAGGPKCDQCPIPRGFGTPMMSHRGPNRGPEMRHDKAGREDHHFGRVPDRRDPRMEQDSRRSDRPDLGHTGKSRGSQMAPVSPC